MDQPNYDMEDVGRFQVARLIEERDALREALNAALDALKSAPKPQSRYLGLTEALIAWRENYDLWYEDQRQAALGLEEGE